jgi:hypothetical protein
MATAEQAGGVQLRKTERSIAAERILHQCRAGRISDAHSAAGVR